MRDHIECGPDEVYIGNSKTEIGIPEHLRVLETARLGKQALDWDGESLDPNEYLPMFISQCEYAKYNRIQTQRLERTRRDSMRLYSAAARGDAIMLTLADLKPITLTKDNATKLRDSLTAALRWLEL